MDFDIRTRDTALKFVLQLLGMTEKELLHYYPVNDDYETLWRNNKDRLDAVDIKPLRVMAFHVTGVLDGCRSIQKYGILNLQQAVTIDTPLKRMFDRYGLSIDIASKVLKYQGEAVDIDYDHFRNRFPRTMMEKATKSVAHRIFYDYCVNGFLVNDNVYSYGTNIHLRPEFILDLIKLFPELEAMEQEWVLRHESYRIDFFAYLKQIARFTFSLDNDAALPFEEWQSLSDDQKLKKWMLYRALDRIFDDSSSEEFIYINNNMNIPPEQILRYTRISDFPQPWRNVKEHETPTSAKTYGD